MPNELKHRIKSVEHRTDVDFSDHCPIVLEMESNFTSFHVPNSYKIPIINQAGSEIGEFEHPVSTAPNPNNDLAHQAQPPKDPSTNPVTNYPPRTRVLLKARTRQIIPVHLVRTDLSEGYLERIDVENNGIYIGESLVKMDNNSCKVPKIIL